MYATFSISSLQLHLKCSYSYSYSFLRFYRSEVWVSKMDQNKRQIPWIDWLSLLLRNVLVHIHIIYIYIFIYF